ncbi:hypothetical protein QYF61_017082, partial [Mycteria americana]
MKKINSISAETRTTADLTGTQRMYSSHTEDAQSASSKLTAEAQQAQKRDAAEVQHMCRHVQQMCSRHAADVQQIRCRCTFPKRKRQNAFPWKKELGVVESDEVSPQPPFLQAEQPQVPQPLPISLVLQTLPQLRCPSLDTLQPLNVSLVVRGPTLNTAFEVRPRQCRVQGHGHCPSPAGHAIADTSQDAMGFLGRLGTLLAHIQAAVNQHPRSFSARQLSSHSFKHLNSAVGPPVRLSLRERGGLGRDAAISKVLSKVMEQETTTKGSPIRDLWIPVQNCSPGSKILPALGGLPGPLPTSTPDTPIASEGMRKAEEKMKE